MCILPFVDDTTTALVAEQQVTPDVPIAHVQLSSTNPGTLLSVSSSQLYAFSNWNISQGSSSFAISMNVHVHVASTCIVHAGTASQPPTVAMEPDSNICMSFYFS